MTWSQPEQVPTIAEMVAEVKQTVAGLDNQIRRICTAVHRHLIEAWYDSDAPPGNIVVHGPSGGGKTYGLRRILEASGLPFIEENATQFSEVGYRGRDLAWMFQDFITKYADNEKGATRRAISMAERWGVVILDEFDKWHMSPKTAMERLGSSGRGLQAELLKIVEGDLVISKTHEEGQGIPVQTGRIMFIACGAFEGLDSQMQKRLGDSAEHSFPNLYTKADTVDLMEYGFMQELIGRFPVIVALPPLRADHMRQILEATIWPRYVLEAAHVGVELVADDGALTKVAQDAVTKRIGARAFPALLDAYLDRAWATAVPGDRIVMDIPSLATWSPDGGGARVEHGAAALRIA
jgi:ATP-dependent Clp protease ATP-binding subunit ClpX